MLFFTLSQIMNRVRFSIRFKCNIYNIQIPWTLHNSSNISDQNKAQSWPSVDSSCIASFVWGLLAGFSGAVKFERSPLAEQSRLLSAIMLSQCGVGGHSNNREWNHFQMCTDMNAKLEQLSKHGAEKLVWQGTLPRTQLLHLYIETTVILGT